MSNSSNNLEELKEKAQRVKGKGSREKAKAAAGKSANRSRQSRAGRARADAPTPEEGLKGRKELNERRSRFGREKTLRSGVSGEKKLDEEADEVQDGSSGSDSDISSTGEENNDAQIAKNRTRREIRESMVTAPLSLKFWQIQGDMGDDVGGHLTFPKQSYRISRKEINKRRKENGNKDAAGPGSGFSVDKTPQMAIEKNVRSTTIGRVRRRLGQELSTKQTQASASASKNNKKQTIKEDIVKSLSDDWFSPSGHVKTLPDPLYSGRIMPSALATSGGALEIVKPEEFRTTHNQGQLGSTSLLGSSKGRRSQVVIKFGRLRFTDHKNFKEEDIIANQLINAHTEYFKILSTDQEAHRLSRVLICTSIVESKSEEVRQYNLLEQKQGTELLNLAMDMFTAWSEYIDTFRTVRTLEKTIYDTWRRLKAHREKEKISCTSLHLEVRQMNSTVSPNTGWEKLTASMRLLEQVLDKLEPKILEKASSMSGTSNSMKDRAAKQFADFEQYLPFLQLSKRGTIPVFLLSEKHAITPTGELDPTLYNDEIRRRQTLANYQYYGRLMINGYQVDKTRVASLRWPEFEVDFGSTMRIEVVRRPEKVVLEIYKKGRITDTFISTIPIGLSGETDISSSATAYAPVFAQYSFCSPTSDIPYALERLTELQNDDDNDDGEDDETKPLMLNKSGRYTSGRIEITTTWLGWLTESTEEDGSKLWAPLPPERRENNHAKLIGGEVDINGGLSGKESLRGGSKLHEKNHSLHLLSSLGNTRLDPNDPNNTALIDLMRQHGKSTTSGILRGSEPYRVESLVGHNAATFRSRDSSMYRVPERQLLLQLRYAMPHLFHNGKPLPLIDDEILKDPHWRIMLTPKNKAKILGGTVGMNEEEEEETEPDYFGFDSEFLLRRQNKMKSFVEKVRASQLELRTNRRRSGMLSRWVREGIMPDFQFDLSFILNKLAPKRKLKPAPKKRKEAPMVKDVYVIVQIASGFNIPQRRIAVDDKGATVGTGAVQPPGSPDRSNRRGVPRQRSPDRRGLGVGDGDDSEDEFSDDEYGNGGKVCNTFVEGSFQGQHPRTSPRTGTQPMWNETLRMRFIPAYSGTQNRWTSSNLKQVRDKVRISVFDEQVHQNEKDFRHKNSVNERRERRYLGSVSIPFTTLYRRKTIQGLFRIDRPEINLAYENPIVAEDNNPDSVIVPGSERALKIASAEATYINMMVTLDPPLQAIQDEDSIEDTSFVTSESESVLKRAKFFHKMADPKRGPIKAVVPTLNGERVHICRFLTAQKPPPEIKSFTEAARYVSLIPFMEDWQLFAGKEDMWSFSSQFLELCAGDWEEHAVLLRNYFAYLDSNRYENFLVFGHGLPEGNTVYVMRRLADDVEAEITFFNASTGIEYTRTDTRCCLQSISCVVTEDNLYVNIQQTGMPSRMKFDFENTKCWKPFFDKKYTRPHEFDTSKCQPEIKYTPTPQKDLEGLERQILETLRVDLKEWRSKSYQTYLNTSISLELKKTLEGLENHKMGRDGFTENNHLFALNKWTATYDFSGYPLNFTFTDIKSISYALKDTNIHMNEDPEVKFALTVKCFGYSNGVISVWVYAAALVRR